MMSASKVTNDDISEDKDIHTSDFEAAAQDIQNRVCFCLGTATAESHCFHKLWRGQGARTMTTLTTVVIAVATMVMARWRRDKWDGNDVWTKTTHQRWWQRQRRRCREHRGQRREMGIFSSLVMLLRETVEDCHEWVPMMAMVEWWTRNTIMPDWGLEGHHWWSWMRLTEQEGHKRSMTMEWGLSLPPPLPPHSQWWHLDEQGVLVVAKVCRNCTVKFNTVYVMLIPYYLSTICSVLAVPLLFETSV